MRIDSCRNCGNTVSVLKYCEVCNQPKQLKCKNCSKFVDDPIHFQCEAISSVCN